MFISRLEVEYRIGTVYYKHFTLNIDLNIWLKFDLKLVELKIKITICRFVTFNKLKLMPLKFYKQIFEKSKQ